MTNIAEGIELLKRLRDQLGASNELHHIRRDDVSYLFDSVQAMDRAITKAVIAASEGYSFVHKLEMMSDHIYDHTLATYVKSRYCGRQMLNQFIETGIADCNFSIGSKGYMLYQYVEKNK